MKYETTALMKRLEKMLRENYDEHGDCEDACPHKEDDSFGYAAAQILEIVAESLDDTLRGVVR